MNRFSNRPVRETLADTSECTDIDQLVSQTSKQFKLNHKQDIAFRIVTKAYLCWKVASSSEISNGPELYPMRMFLTGPGGMGKTHVIRALMSIMECCGDKHALWFLAPTGSAAAINDGMTIHKVFSLKVPDKLSQHSTQTMDGRGAFTTSLSVTSRNKLHQNFKDVEVLVIDEVSLLDQAILPEIDARCRFAKERPHWWFGGMIVIFTGDLYQFPPIRGSPIYSRVKEQTPIDDCNLNKRLGHMIWNSLTDAVCLKEQKRMEKDPEYGAAVQHLCLWHCTPEDIKLFNTRVIKSTDLKITNGAQGFLCHMETEKDQYRYVYAKYAVVEFPSSNVELPGLPRGCFPIMLVTWSFKQQIVNVQGKTVNVSISHEQMPFQ